MIKKCPQKLTALCTALAFTTTVQGEINTATIMASSASTSCLEYKVVGTCFWLFCTYFGCKVRTSTKVRHFFYLKWWFQPITTMGKIRGQK